MEITFDRKKLYSKLKSNRSLNRSAQYALQAIQQASLEDLLNTKSVPYEYEQQTSFC